MALIKFSNFIRQWRLPADCNGLEQRRNRPQRLRSKCPVDHVEEKRVPEQL